MRNYVVAKTSGIQRMRHFQVEWLGMNWFRRMTDGEWDAVKHKFVVLKDGIHSEQDICDFIAREKQIGIDRAREPLFKFILVPDYSETESLFILKAQHTATDGLGIAIIL